MKMRQEQLPPPVLLVDDEEHILQSFSLYLRSSGLKQVVSIQNSKELLPFLAKNDAAVILLDLFMPHMSGIQLLPQIKAQYPEIPVIVITASQEVETAVNCMRDGAFDYMVKPVEKNRLVSAVKRAVEITRLRREVGSLKEYLLNDNLHHSELFSAIITRNKRMRAIFQYMEAISGSVEPLLITGATGVGKGMLAETMHLLDSPGGELVSLNVAGLDDNMFSDTLFGHKRGAFSGADSVREGLIAKAAGGTLFLDEIGDLTMTSQVKLLTLLQDHSYYPLGSDMPKTSDARIIAATNQNLKQKMSDGTFRQDLYYRLSSHIITIPALSERTGDIPFLVGHFMEEAAKSLKKLTPSPPPELFTLLSLYHFPGNVRELRAMICDAMAQHHSGLVISMEHFKEYTKTNRVTSSAIVNSDSEPNLPHPAITFSGPFPTLKESDEILIDEAMLRANNNQGIAATLLGITRQSLNRRLVNRKNK
jgi:two-component system, NtrC family, response regulator HydG